MKLSELLIDVADSGQDVQITHIALDSREISSGGVFFALTGAKQHGLQFAKKVLQQGAVAIVYDPAGQGEVLAKLVTGIPLVAVENLAEKLGGLAARFFGEPTQKLNVIGITGTNGKTSCSQFLAQVLDKCGVIGTLGWGDYADLQQTINTTPDAIMLQKIYAQFVETGVENVAMEVSSHGLAQGRVNAIKFNGAVFNNLSRDHLDYHGDLESYFLTKLQLVQWPGLKYVVVNLDDAYAERVIAAILHGVAVYTYSMQQKEYLHESSIQVQNIQYELTGIECDVFWQSQQECLQVSLLGDFNLQNCLAVLAVLLAMGKTLKESVLLIKNIKPVLGRMECFQAKEKPMVVVDYAHTPDALEKALKTLRHHCTARLTVVFGCGGDRDKGKRSAMGSIAKEYADHIIVTDDNPRYEIGTDIIAQIISGLNSDKVSTINDRRAAIQQSILMSSADDMVLIAGKGHEDYQEVKGIRLPFSDREIVQEYLA